MTVQMFLTLLLLHHHHKTAAWSCLPACLSYTNNKNVITRNNNFAELRCDLRERGGLPSHLVTRRPNGGKD